MPAMRLEIQYACGVYIADKKFIKPKPWVLRALRIAIADIQKLFGPVSSATPATAHQLGALVGLGKTFASVLDGNAMGDAELEKKHPEYALFRSKVASVITPEIEFSTQIEEKVSGAKLTPEGELLFGKGRYEGSQVVVDESGQYQDDASLRQTVCWFLWLYWPEVKHFKSMPELLAFLVEDFQMKTLTLANLTNICGEIELRFKGRGRPAR